MALLSRCQLELRNDTCRGFAVGHCGCRCWLAAVIDGCFFVQGAWRQMAGAHLHVLAVCVTALSMCVWCQWGFCAPSGFPLTDTPISEVQALSFSTKTFARSAGTNRPPWS